jgi:transposase-like protein
MSLEHAPAREVGRAAYTISEFCEAWRISRTQLYKQWREGIGPRFMRNGTKIIITHEAAVVWSHEREAATAAAEKVA